MSNQDVIPVDTEIAKHNVTSFFNPIIWEQMKGMARTFKASGALPQSDNEATIAMKIQAGYEMGMTPIESIKSFYFVNGAINIFGAAVIRRLREHGWQIKYEDGNDSCTATVSKGDESYTDTLSFKEAEDSKWTRTSSGSLKAGWIAGANRKMKLRYGVISMIIKTYIPEVLGSAADIAEIAEDAGATISGEIKMATESQKKALRDLEVKVDDIDNLTFEQAQELYKNEINGGSKQ